MNSISGDNLLFSWHREGRLLWPWIYSKYIVWSLYLAQSSQNVINVLSNRSSGSILCHNVVSSPQVLKAEWFPKSPFSHDWVYVNEVTFGNFLKVGGVGGAVSQRNQPWLESCSFSPKQPPMASDWLNHAWVIESPPQKTSKRGFREPLGLWTGTHPWMGPQTPPMDGPEVPSSHSRPHLVYPFIWLFIYAFNIFYNKPVLYWINWFPEFCELL